MARCISVWKDEYHSANLIYCASDDMLTVKNCLIKMKNLILIIYGGFFNLGEKTVEETPIQGALISAIISFLSHSRDAKMARCISVWNGAFLSVYVIYCASDDYCL